MLHLLQLIKLLWLIRLLYPLQFLPSYYRSYNCPVALLAATITYALAIPAAPVALPAATITSALAIPAAPPATTIKAAFAASPSLPATVTYLS